MKAWNRCKLAINELFTGEVEDTWPSLRPAHQTLSCYGLRSELGSSLSRSPAKPSHSPGVQIALRHPPKYASESRGFGNDLETDHLAESKLAHLFVP
jgi:hypothetical protein